MVEITNMAAIPYLIASTHMVAHSSTPRGFSDYFHPASKGTTLIWLTDICVGEIPVYIELNELKTAILLA